MTIRKKTTNVNQAPQENRKSLHPQKGDTPSENETRVFENWLRNYLGKDIFQKLNKQATRENKSVEQVYHEQYTHLCDLAEMGVITVNDPVDIQKNQDHT